MHKKISRARRCVSKVICVGRSAATWMLTFGVLMLTPVGVLRAEILPLSDSVEAFLDRQLDKFALPGDYPVGFEQARLIQTFDLLPPEFMPGEDPLRHRADIYDSSLAAIYYTQRGNLARAQQLADGLRLVQSLDPFADGRVRTSYFANDLLAPGNASPSISSPNAATGNNAWAGLALTRFYAAASDTNFLTSVERDTYLDAARDVGDWLIGNTQQPVTVDDPFGGFSLALDSADNPVFNTDVRSVEGNIDVFVLGMNLAELDPTNAAKWQGMAEHAQTFVQEVFDAVGGKYWIGTRDGAMPGAPVANTSPVPTDTQTWTTLAGLDSTANTDRALDWLFDATFGTVTEDTVTDSGEGDVTLIGTKFSDTGEHIHSEMTAGAAMALVLAGRAADAAVMIDSLEVTRLDLPESDSDGAGILATPWPAGGLIEAGGSPVLHNFHVASTVWTGLLGLFNSGDMTANPLSSEFVDVGAPDIPEPGVGIILGVGLVIIRAGNRGRPFREAR